jgi:hypothetical protein
LASGSFHESVSPQPQSISLRPFRIFSKIRGDIRNSRFATGVNDTGGKWKKSSIRKILIILFGHLWVVEDIYIQYKFLPSSSLSGVCSLILFQVFATGVNDTGGKFAAGFVDTGGNLPPASLTPVANLPPVSTTQGELVAKFCRRCRLYRWQIWHRCQRHRW